MTRPQPIVLLVFVVVVLGVLAQVVPFYTDWLWFGEVGYTTVFWNTLSLRGRLFTAVTVGVLVFLWSNLTLAARTAAPDVLWELEDQLGLPGRVVIEPLIRRFLPIVLTVIAIISGLRASSRLGDRARLQQRAALQRQGPARGVRPRPGLLRLPAADVAPRPRLGHRAGRRHHAADAGALHPAAQPRPHHSRPAAGRRRPHPPAAARRRLARRSRPWGSGSTATRSCSRRAAWSSAPPTPTSTPPCRCCPC